MEFKSQICTSRSQSERLLALGLKKETADMKHIPYSKYAVPKYFDDGFGFEDAEYIPAWSLHRLMEMSAVDNGRILINIDIPVEVDFYNEVVNTIESLIKKGLFNKDYLEGTKCSEIGY